MDILTNIGLLALFQYAKASKKGFQHASRKKLCSCNLSFVEARRLTPGSTCWLAVPCSTWIFMPLVFDNTTKHFALWAWTNIGNQFSLEEWKRSWRNPKCHPFLSELLLLNLFRGHVDPLTVAIGAQQDSNSFSCFYGWWKILFVISGTHQFPTEKLPNTSFTSYVGSAAAALAGNILYTSVEQANRLCRRVCYLPGP